jgi:hypothetical protein
MGVEKDTIVPVFWQGLCLSDTNENRVEPRVRILSLKID